MCAAPCRRTIGGSHFSSSLHVRVGRGEALAPFAFALKNLKKRDANKKSGRGRARGREKFSIFARNKIKSVLWHHLLQTKL